MAEPARIVKLLKNEIYPTYQLYAQMAKKTPAQEGLRIGVRTVLDWLLLRLAKMCHLTCKNWHRKRIHCSPTM